MIKLLITLLLIPMVSFGDYSIITKDGIQINNIPDNIPRDSDILKKRVEEARLEYLGELIKNKVENRKIEIQYLPIPCEDALEGMPCLKLP